MLIKRLLLICSLSASLVGCSEFYGSQPPAPVYGSESTVTAPSLPEPKASKPITPEPIDQGSNEIVKTEPLKEFVPITTPIEELKPEQPLMPEQEPLASDQGALSTEQELFTTSARAISGASDYCANTRVCGAATTTPPPPPPPPPFEPLESFAPLSPAVGALALAANQNSKSGNIESATTTIERAIRIEPRNATLYYKLALLRLKQSKPRLAEDLAKKAALLASDDTQLKKHSWLLVARAREVQGDLKGGKEARAMADKF